MKIFRTLTLSMVLFSVALLAQDKDAKKETDKKTDPAAEKTEEEAAKDPNADASPDIVENPEGEAKKTKTFEPAGALTREYQYIFEQGTVSFDGFDIIDRNNWKKKIGRLDGQTGWTGVNQAGEKTMSYQIAFVIKADRSLANLFLPVSGNRQENQTSQLGWFIPSRGQDFPAEQFTMQLCDINLKP